MSSTTPGQGAADNTAEPRQDGHGPTRTPSSSDRSALRTSLAERFAAAKGIAEDPVVPRLGDTAPAGTAAVPLRPGSSGAPGGSAAAPRYDAETTATQPVASAKTQPVASANRAAPASAGQGAAAPAGQGAPTDAAPPAPRPAATGPRRVRLSVARLDPWSVMKLSFLLSIAIGIGIVVAAAAMWFVLDSMQVFADIEELLLTIDSENFLQLMDYLQFDRVISLAAIIAVVDVLLLTALATLGAFLYNIVAALVGGVHLTLTDD